MTLAEALSSVRFIVDSEGRQTDVVLPLEVWESLIDWLENVEDLALARDWLARRRGAGSAEEMGLTPWETVVVDMENGDNPLDHEEKL